MYEQGNKLAMAKQGDERLRSLRSTTMLQPLRHPLFRAFWLATFFSNVGTWIQDVAGAWVMTSFASSPAMVALVQVAANVPMFLFALPAGALADVIERRLLLLVTLGWQLAAALS